MTTTPCELTLQALRLGLAPPESGHLESCAACREEARALGALYQQLAGSAAIRPPAALDSAVRQALVASIRKRGVELRVVPAVLLATLGLGGFVSCLSMLLELTPLAEFAPFAALGLVGAYLAACTAAATPLLIRHRRLMALVAQETH